MWQRHTKQVCKDRGDNTSDSCQLRWTWCPVKLAAWPADRDLKPVGLALSTRARSYGTRPSIFHAEIAPMSVLEAPSVDRAATAKSAHRTKAFYACVRFPTLESCTWRLLQLWPVERSHMEGRDRQADPYRPLNSRLRGLYLSQPLKSDAGNAARDGRGTFVERLWNASCGRWRHDLSVRVLTMRCWEV